MEEPKDLIPNTLSRLGIKALNEMQVATLEAVETHDDIILRSPTGSGKTLAFLLPILLRLGRDIKTTQAIIVVPSSELEQQIQSECKAMRTVYKVKC
jgi:ATP-independent RNA helicase DbpA